MLIVHILSRFGEELDAGRCSRRGVDPVLATHVFLTSLFGLMAPKAASAEFFGFYDVSSKFAGIAGPALFALVGQLTGSSRLSIVALVIFFIGGIVLLSQVDEKEGLKVAEEENRGAALAGA